MSKYAVKCHGDSVPEVGSCGIVYLNREGQHGYLWQMNYADRGWYCPNCGSTATFQDDIYEESLEGEHKLFARSGKSVKHLVVLKLGVIRLKTV